MTSCLLAIRKCAAFTLAEVFSPHPNSQRKTAFTLAEVLITLGIIGIVAALVLPQVLTKIEKKRNVTILKRAYSDLNQYVQAFSYENDCGSSFANCAPADGEFVNKFAQYLVEKQNFKYDYDKIDKLNTRIFVRRTNKNNCDEGRNCEMLTVKTNPNTYGAHYLVSPTTGYVYVLEVYMGDYCENIHNYCYSFNHNDGFRARINIITDLRSVKFGRFMPKTSKLQYGKNTFETYVTHLQKLPVNGSPLCYTNGYYCKKMKENDCTDGNSYERCFQKIIEDGWEIKYNY